MRAYAHVHPNDPLVKANLDLLPDANAESWTAGGNCDFTSFIWWAIGGGIAFPGLIPLGFLFGGKGEELGGLGHVCPCSQAHLWSTPRR